jgi:hypothetical protein
VEKNVKRTPSAATVNRIVDSKLAVSEKNIGSVLKDKKTYNMIHGLDH